MRRLYWHPRKVSPAALVLLSVLALIGMFCAERFKVPTAQPWFDQKQEAARLARTAMEAIRDERLARGIPIDRRSDPTGSGLIGLPMSPVTSDPGVLSAKQTSVNPNFAAVIVEMLRRAGTREGDAVAIGCSGSFPALNICTYAAAQALKLRPVVISSAAASQWGANIPELLWIDMEQVLRERGVLPFVSTAASIGGIDDQALGMTDEGRETLRAAIERHKLPLIDTNSLSEGISRRMGLYREKAAGEIRAYVNIGGGTTSVGSSRGKRLFHPGLNPAPPPGAELVDSVMTRFVMAGVPVIHLVQIEQLAARYGLPLEPAVVPEVGKGTVFYRDEYSVPLAVGVLAAIALVSVLILLTRPAPKRLQTSAPTPHPDDGAL